MSNEHLYALVMAGGGGTRLWPMSRHTHPKQMLKLFGDRTMFQLSVDRLLPLLPVEHVLVVTAAEQVDGLAAQYPSLPRENFIVEPTGRGTASCIGLAALHLRRRDPEAVMVVVTADHFIQKEEAFRETLLAAQEIAGQGHLVTLGITPTEPSTGYGYICRGADLGVAHGLPYFRVKHFTEKPDLAAAQRFLQEGTYSWNSGMFIWRVDRILEEIQRWMPALCDTLLTLDAVLDTPAYMETLQRHWPAVHKETIDYGIMERADRVAVIPVDLGWSDIGAWPAVMALHTTDAHNNVVVGDVIPLDTFDTMIFAHGDRLVATIGINDLIIVDTPDALLIARPDQAQRVRDIVDQLKAGGREDKL